MRRNVKSRFFDRDTQSQEKPLKSFRSQARPTGWRRWWQKVKHLEKIQEKISHREIGKGDQNRRRFKPIISASQPEFHEKRTIEEEPLQNLQNEKTGKPKKGNQRCDVETIFDSMSIYQNQHRCPENEKRNSQRVHKAYCLLWKKKTTKDLIHVVVS